MIVKAKEKPYKKNMKIKSQSPKASQDIYVGFAGAGLSSLPDNVAIKAFGAEIGAQMYKAEAVIGAPIRAAKKYILQQLAQNPNANLYLFGYSAGGDAVIKLSRLLKKHQIKVCGLVTFDPHSPLRLYGFDDYKITNNILHHLNFYQHNPISHVIGCPWGTNPFKGGRVFENGVTQVENIDVSEDCVHVGAFYKPLARYTNAIQKALNLVETQ